MRHSCSQRVRACRAGAEGVGVVESVGPGTTKVKQGDRVVAVPQFNQLRPRGRALCLSLDSGRL